MKRGQAAKRRRQPGASGGNPHPSRFPTEYNKLESSPSLEHRGGNFFPMSEAKEQVVLRLENLVRKIKVHSQDTSSIECRVFPPQAHGHPYIIEVYQERYSRRVPVDTMTLSRLMLGQPDPALMRDLRTAILAVMRLSQRRQKD